VERQSGRLSDSKLYGEDCCGIDKALNRGFSMRRKMPDYRSKNCILYVHGQEFSNPIIRKTFDFVTIGSINATVCL
jgi:hypothetical protein